VPIGSRVACGRRACAALTLAVLAASRSAAQEPAGPAAAFEQAAAAAEGRLRQGDLRGAETAYREALFHGWLLLGTIEWLGRRLPEAREAVRQAALFEVERADALQSLALAQLRVGDARQAVEILGQVEALAPGDAHALRLLAKALAATGQTERAVSKLDEASSLAAGDPELLFVLATEYLWLKKVEAAERLFAVIVAARPIPQTRVLIGRSYRDAGEYARARTELLAALAQDPRARRAHYYLGMVLLADATTGPERLDKAIAEFQAELELAPEDPLANDQLGVALLDAGRQADALAALETAVRAEPRSLYVYHLGRGLLALGRVEEAAATTRRALELAHEQGAADSELEKIHYQLALALRRLGRADEAASHLTQARQLAAGAAPSASEDFSSGTVAPETAQAGVGAASEAGLLSALPAPARRELKARVTTGLARAYFNLGVLQAQGQKTVPAAERFARAAEFFEGAARLDPDFPQVQSSLGVAYFNARRFDKATEPLARALERQPDDRGLKRMLATSWLNTEAWEKAARLLEDAETRGTDAGLESAYGLALLRSGRAAEAEAVLTGLLRAQGDSAELHVLLGQARERQGKHDAAAQSLTRALQLKPDVAEADATLGRILLARGMAADALPHLEAAARLAPEDADLHDLLGQAYQQLGRAELARQAFEASRRLKARP
jgi:tetratricopeptide (TPR) repeat protein